MCIRNSSYRQAIVGTYATLYEPSLRSNTSASHVYFSLAHAEWEVSTSFWHLMASRPWNRTARCHHACKRRMTAVAWPSSRAALEHRSGRRAARRRRSARRRRRSCCRSGRPRTRQIQRRRRSKQEFSHIADLIERLESKAPEGMTAAGGARSDFAGGWLHRYSTSNRWAVLIA